MLEESDIGVQHDAKMLNYSELGLYFEADFQLQIKAEIRIGIINSPFASQPDKYESYRGIVKWRRELKKSAYYYGYGVELIEEDAFGDQQIWDDETRAHPRKECTIPVKYESENQKFDAIAKNVSVGGAFIKTRDRLVVGQQIILEVPLKAKGKIARLTGKVARSNQQGFGIKFLRSK
jgi:hypothetical protein